MMSDMVSQNEIEQYLNNIIPEVLNLRRELHRSPELAWQEIATTDRITQFLQKHNYANIQKPLTTGLFVDKIADPSQQLIALRADIDALPIQDEKKVDYHSRIPGVSHACGHDAHISVVCGVAAVVNAMGRKLPVNLRFIFQPAEEPIPSGAPRMIEGGALEGVHNALGLHVDPTFPIGTVGLTSGWVNAQSVKLSWKIIGSGGHSARPYQASDPLWAATQLVNMVYEISGRRWSRPEYPSVITFTRFHSGEAYNAIAENAELMATLRLTDTERLRSVVAELEDLHRFLEKRHGVRIQFEHLAGSPPVLNDKRVIDKLSKGLEHFQPNIFNVEQGYRSMGGDDFGWYSKMIPSAMIRFGISGKNPAPALHTGTFDVPDKAIKLAVLFFVYQLFLWKAD